MTVVGRVLGTEDAQPLDFWVGIQEGSYLQLDDVVTVATELPDRTQVRLFGIVDQVRSRYEGAKFDSDVFRVAEGILPVGVSTAAHVSATRIEPEVLIPPRPGQEVSRANADERDIALYFDQMTRKFPAGLSRDGQIIYGNLDFLDGTKGAHINISGISGVATKTSYALFLLYGLFHSESLGTAAANTHALVFNVKGEDLLWLDKPNAHLSDEHRDKYTALGLPAKPFASVGLWAPVRRGDQTIPDTGGRQEDVTGYYWSLREFCSDRLLSFMFAEADNELSQIEFVIRLVERWLEQLERSQKHDNPWLDFDGERFESFSDLVVYIVDHIDLIAGSAAVGTQHAFARRLENAAMAMGHLIRSERKKDAEKHKINWQAKQVSVIDIHNLPDRAKRFVVGVIMKKLMEEKERIGRKDPLVFLVLDELNKYAPREGWSPIKEVVLDIAERGRSLGVVLMGAQQTASEIERRVVANASFRVVGRLDAGEAQRAEYGYLTAPARARAALLKPGNMFFQQPEVPVPLLVQFPFPAWATRADEVAEPNDGKPPRGFKS